MFLDCGAFSPVAEIRHSMDLITHLTVGTMGAKQ
jgi:hypothetical protein